MNRDRIAYLINVTYTQDEIGQDVPVENKKKIFCNISSVSAAEWFEAGRNGLQAELRITMFAFDYNGEDIVEIEGNRYSVYRTYRAKADEIELYLEKKAGSENGG